VAGVAAAILLAGCGGVTRPIAEVEQAREACGSADCHDETIDLIAAGPHVRLECATCHAGADGEHASDPEASAAPIDWTIDACSPCHVGEASTYLYDDNAQAGPFGGSTRVPPQPKAETFPLYAQVAAGHPFTKEYNEEGAHRFMLEDHYATTRGKFETCVQCKSTKVAWAWLNGKQLTVAEDTEITLTHTAAPGVAAKKLTVPKGTTLDLATDAAHEVDAVVTLPDGTVYSSRPSASEDATANFAMTWAATIAAIKETMPYGAGCNHCHDPHSAKPRIVRQSLIRAVESGGVNPYAAQPTADFESARSTDREILLCAQCHVEYTCGKSSIDGIDRDIFSWSKAGDLHEFYLGTFDYTQDWKHKTIGEPLIKSQHPETELYWQSDHYGTGASCEDCHMPEVRDRVTGRVFRSHWLTSPYKFHDPDLFSAFASANDLDLSYNERPCERCHPDRMAEGIAGQRDIFARQATVQALLARSASALGAAKASLGTKAAQNAGYSSALESHRKAHALWENLIVSENSMGFHNYAEVSEAMTEAERLAGDAIEKAEALAR
jgi:formate-dependent nitrite reductase cytochrome c552 subunit